ncbi:MAG: hypothetical protein HOK49_01500 [Opitutae bacterium]|jgi:hypothetical protein|nr:hypothetical protein [Opitutae bacterium]MBT6461189.1 hypothetical protein [Opitutae bacterium]MBT6957482.1 hypothetical protein [Opitutae bacterium]
MDKITITEDDFEDSSSCPYCGEGIQTGSARYCPACEVPHHMECWEVNGGCTGFGCREAPSEETQTWAGPAGGSIQPVPPQAPSRQAKPWQRQTQSATAYHSTTPAPTPQNTNSGMVTAGYVFCILALLCFPGLFGLLAFIFGIINCAQNRVSHGVTQIVLSLIFVMIHAVIMSGY